LSTRHSKFELHGFEVSGAPIATLASAVRSLDDVPLVSCTPDSIELLFSPMDVPSESCMAEHFRRFDVVVKPVIRGCDEFFGSRRVRTLSLGLPAVAAAPTPVRALG
jgi:hypothetical protein